MGSIKLSQSYVDKLAKTSLPEKDIYISDSELTGFQIKRTPAGQISFIARSRVGKYGNPKRLKLGVYPALSVKEARIIASEQLNLMRQGLDPVQIKKDQEAVKAEKKAIETARSVTFGEVLDKKLALKPLKAEHGIRTVLEAYSSDWLNRPIKDITRTEVQERFIQIREGNISAKDRHGKAIQIGTENQAKKWARYGKSVCSFAMGIEVEGTDLLLVERNPFAVLKAVGINLKTKRRKVSVRHTELREMFLAASTYGNRSLARWWILTLFTGLRAQEGLSLKWENVSFKDEYFIIKDTKNGEDHLVPFNPAVKGILEAQRNLSVINYNPEIDEEIYSDYVFHNAKGDGPLKDPRGIYHHISKVMGRDIRTHDLRRAFTDLCERAGLNWQSIKKALNHSMASDVTAGYWSADFDLHRERMQQVYRLIAKAMIDGGENLNDRQLDIKTLHTLGGTIGLIGNGYLEPPE